MAPGGAPGPLNHDPEAVRAARVRAGLSAEQLASRCLLSVSLVKKIEEGTRNATPPVLAELARVLGCRVAELERRRDVADAVAAAPVAVQLGVLRALVGRFPRAAAGLLAEHGGAVLCPLAHDSDAVLDGRQLAGLTQAQLAQACGVTARFVGGIERGELRVPAGRVGALAEALGCPHVNNPRVKAGQR